MASFYQPRRARTIPATMAQAVRVCLGAVEHHARVEQGLRVLADILAEAPRPNLSVI